MECLYSTSIIYTFEEYKRFNIKALFTRNRIIRYIAIEAFIIVAAFLMSSFLLLVYAFIYPIILLLLPVFQNLHSKKVWNTNKSMQNMNVKYDFYNTYFIENDNNGETKLEYKKLYKIIETKTNFYLMISKNQGFLLNKSNFPKGLDDFLRNIKTSK